MSWFPSSMFWPRPLVPVTLRFALALALALGLGLALMPDTAFAKKSKKAGAAKRQGPCDKLRPPQALSKKQKMKFDGNFRYAMYAVGLKGEYHSAERTRVLGEEDLAIAYFNYQTCLMLKRGLIDKPTAQDLIRHAMGVGEGGHSSPGNNTRPEPSTPSPRADPSQGAARSKPRRRKPKLKKKTVYNPFWSCYSTSSKCSRYKATVPVHLGTVAFSQTVGPTRSGLQLAVLSKSKSDAWTGLGLGVVRIGKNDVDGGQLALVAKAGGASNGGTVGALYAGSRSTRGAKVGLVARTERQLTGAQIGVLYGTAGKTRGVQVGLINRTQKLKGVQIGLVNLRQDGPSIPIINVGW